MQNSRNGGEVSNIRLNHSSFVSPCRPPRWAGQRDRRVCTNCGRRRRQIRGHHRLVRAVAGGWSLAHRNDMFYHFDSGMLFRKLPTLTDSEYRAQFVFYHKHLLNQISSPTRYMGTQTLTLIQSLTITLIMSLTPILASVVDFRRGYCQYHNTTKYW